MKKLFLIILVLPIFNILNASDALWRALKTKNLELLRKELQNSNDLSKDLNEDNDRMRPLKQAVHDGDMRIIKELLKFGADVYHCGHCYKDNSINKYMFDIATATWYIENDQKDCAIKGLANFSREDQVIIFKNWINNNKVKTFPLIVERLCLDPKFAKDFFDARIREKVSNMMLSENSDIEWKNLYESVRSLDTFNFGLLMNRAYSDVEIITSR